MTADSRSASRVSSASSGKSAGGFARPAEKLSFQHPQQGHPGDAAVEAHLVTPHDPVVVTAGGAMLPTVPLDKAEKLHKLNTLNDVSEGNDFVMDVEDSDSKTMVGETDDSDDSHEKKATALSRLHGKTAHRSGEGNLAKAMPPSHTNPLFPALPLYGPPSILRHVQCLAFRISSFLLSATFFGGIVLGALFASVTPLCRYLWYRVTLRDPDVGRPFYGEEMRSREMRTEQDRAWKRGSSSTNLFKTKSIGADGDGFVPTEGGPDPIVCDVGYYARRVGLDMEEFQVQTEDGFIIDLWHIYDPREYTPLPQHERAQRGPESFTKFRRPQRVDTARRKFPVLMMHGLLQSSGAYCVNDDASLAFMLCKSGFDVWLGNSRCGFRPKHVQLECSDPSMWSWNIRQMGVFDLPALTSRVLFETGFEKIGLICHSQGTTQAFVALAKEQRPDLGDKLTVFCALAPAAYAGPLIGKMYFKFMRLLSPAMFRLVFGIHAFVPIMMTMHRLLHPCIWGRVGYRVFSFMFDWSDTRWDRGLRDRMFQFAPVYVSAESMRWWLGPEGFAKHKCILSTKEEWRAEDLEDSEDSDQGGHDILTSVDRDREGKEGVERSQRVADVIHHANRRKPRGATAWYNEQAPPFALWVCGKDGLVDGRKLLRRFERGREPHVRVVHKKVLEEYEHLDVIWAMDAPEKVFKEVREVLWKTCNVRDECVVPRGCEKIEAWVPDTKGDDSANDGMQSGSSSSEH